MLRHRDGKSMPGGTPVLRDDATGLSKISLLRLHANEHLVISFHVHSSHSAVAHVSLEFGKLTRQTFVRSCFEGGLGACSIRMPSLRTDKRQ